ncbi:hypothetical protein GOP47_0024038 [Adiantum capillus-veneris]|uniref:Metallo-beta-lactamase domain-containing protein n=1 Tax=Adiantum capillus-veneris TaxID=13818 RepID=A0A9D4U5U6_ADICA|nr:hypothetical protein GOP47_0024038 [Adiantum capillus-veneris]
MQPWVYWKFLEQPDFGPGPSVHTILFMTDLNVESVSTLGKWFNSEDAWKTLMAGGNQTDFRVGPLATYAFSPHFSPGLQHRLKLDVKAQEYPPGVLLLPLTSSTLKPFSKTNLVVFSSKVPVEQDALSRLQGEALIVDPGCHPSEAQELLSKIVKSLPKKLFVFLTHHHLDHTEGLPTVYKENPEALVLAHELTIRRLGKVQGKLKCLPVVDGASVLIGNEELRVIAAPGHTDGHMALLHVPSHTLIVGDHCVGQGSSRLDAAGGGNMQDYLSTTRNFIGLAPRVIVPMHGQINLWPLQMLRGYIRYREAREAKILSSINQGARTAFQVVSQAYSDTPPALWIAALSNAKLHVDHLNQLQQLPLDFSKALFQKSCGVGFFLRCLSYSSFRMLKAVPQSHHGVWKVPIAIAVLGCVVFVDKMICHKS